MLHICNDRSPKATLTAVSVALGGEKSQQLIY